MRLFIFIFLSLFTVSQLKGQSFYENKYFGIKIQHPAGWVVAGNEDMDNTLENTELTDEQLQRILSSNKGIISLRTFSKYDAKEFSGFIPTIKITVRANPTSSFSEFKNVMVSSTNKVKATLDDFKLTENFTTVKFSKCDGLHYTCQYSLKIKDAEKMTVRVRYYMIPKSKYFISISLMDEQGKEDCSALFDKLVSTIQLL